DLRASDVVAQLRDLLRFGIFSFSAALLLALLSAFFLSRREALSLQSLCKGVKEIGQGNFSCRVHLFTHDEFDDLAVAINQMAQGLQERDRLKLNFTRYVSQHIMETILKSEAPVKLEGERRKITLLFSDIRQFTKLAEKLPPEEVVSFLNEYFGVMVEVIFKNEGTLDKFIGDGMMIEFGAPLEDPLQEIHAVTTAIEMQQEAQKLCAKWEKEGKPRIEIGIGIHTGIAIVGNIGSERRIEYTAVGDTVNVAARLEQLTKQLKMPILMSESTAKAVEKQFALKNLGPAILPGRTDPIIVYSPIL
ncbi:MAG: adenylate/guanylate cyclase domain-containing protein, partial [Chlamydiales bacterium]